MKKIYQKAIVVGIITVLLMAIFLAFAMYMADRDMKEYYKVQPRPYDNDFVGVVWYLLFGLFSLAILVVAGAVVAAWTSGEISSLKETILVSAMAGAIPTAVITLLIMLFVFLLSISSNMFGSGLGITYAITSLIQYSSCCMIYILVALGLSVIGGLLYALLLKGIKLARIIGYMKNRALIPGIIGGLFTIIVFIGVHYFTAGQFSITLMFLEFLLLIILSLLVGIASALILDPSKNSIKNVFYSSLLSGLFIGIGGALGQFLVAVIKHYNELGILLVYCPYFIIDGVVLASVAGILTYAILDHYRPRMQGTRQKSFYAAAIKIGILVGIPAAIFSISPGMISLLVSQFSTSSAGNSYLYYSLIGGTLVYPVILAIVATGGYAAVKYSPVTKLNDAIAVSGISGAIIGIFITLGDTLATYLRLKSTMLPDTYGGMELQQDVFASNFMSFFQGAPFKMMIIVVAVVLVGIIYGSWILNLKYSDERNASEDV